MTQADVIVVGGGIMGASVAFFLARRGRRVILLERDLVGQAASGTNFGNVRRQGRYLHQLPLSNRALAIWLRLPELIGEDCEFLQSGHLRIAYSEAQATKISDYARDSREHGLDLEMISANALRDRYPYIGREAIAGCLDPSGGHANPRLTAPAFGRAAVRAGVDLRERAEVTGIAKAGDDFVVEVAGQGELRAPALLVVARGNVILGGSTRGPASNDTNRAAVLPENILGQMAQLRRLMPGFANVNIIRVWSGVESYFADDSPVMGPSGTTPGLFYAFGFCGAGFQIGPGVGEVMAELIDTGATSTPIAPYSIARFAAARAGAV